MSVSLLILKKDLSHPAFIAVGINQRYLAFELVKNKFRFHNPANFQSDVLLNEPRLLPNTPFQLSGLVFEFFKISLACVI